MIEEFLHNKFTKWFDGDENRTNRETMINYPVQWKAYQAGHKAAWVESRKVCIEQVLEILKSDEYIIRKITLKEIKQLADHGEE